MNQYLLIFSFVAMICYPVEQREIKDFYENVRMLKLPAPDNLTKRFGEDNFESESLFFKPCPKDKKVVFPLFESLRKEVLTVLQRKKNKQFVAQSKDIACEEFCEFVLPILKHPEILTDLKKPVLVVDVKEKINQKSISIIIARDINLYHWAALVKPQSFIQLGNLTLKELNANIKQKRHVLIFYAMNGYYRKKGYEKELLQTFTDELFKRVPEIDMLLHPALDTNSYMNDTAISTGFKKIALVKKPNKGDRLLMLKENYLKNTLQSES